jgi:CDP-diacylglycerol--glycerol-3-phosphate 3-phosphatidyltransferase
MKRRYKLGFVTALTLVRLPLVLVFLAGALWLEFHNREWLFWLSFLSLALSAVTDLLDGYFARLFDVETAFGAHADPLIDKFFYITTLPLLIFVATFNGDITHGVLLVILTVFLLSRDLWVTFLRSLGAADNISGKANWAGKLRTLLNFPAICVIYFIEASPYHLLPDFTKYPIEALVLVINAVSIYVYTSRYRVSLRNAIRPQGRQ